MDAVRLAGVFADEAIEFEIRDVEERLTGGDVFVDHFDELDAFLVIELAAVLVHAFEIDGGFGGGLVVTGFEAPDIEPVRGAGAIDAKKVEPIKSRLKF